VKRKRNFTQADDDMRMYVGLDVHKMYSQVAVEDEDGVLLLDTLPPEGWEILS